MELYITFSYFHFSYLNLILSCLFTKLYIFITMLSVNTKSQSGFTRLLYLILANNASDSRLLRPSRAEVGECFAVFFV